MIGPLKGMTILGTPAAIADHLNERARRGVEMAIVWFTDFGRPEEYELLRELLAPFPAGSHVALTHGTADAAPEVNAAARVYQAATTPMYVRSRPEVLALSKAELMGNDELRERLENEIGREILAISAVTGAGLADLVRRVVERLSEVAPKA